MVSFVITEYTVLHTLELPSTRHYQNCSVWDVVTLYSICLNSLFRKGIEQKLHLNQSLFQIPSLLLKSNLCKYDCIFWKFTIRPNEILCPVEKFTSLQIKAEDFLLWPSRKTSKFQLNLLQTNSCQKIDKILKAEKSTCPFKRFSSVVLRYSQVSIKRASLLNCT